MLKRRDITRGLPVGGGGRGTRKKGDMLKRRDITRGLSVGSGDVDVEEPLEIQEQP